MRTSVIAKGLVIRALSSKVRVRRCASADDQQRSIDCYPRQSSRQVLRSPIIDMPPGRRLSDCRCHNKCEHNNRSHSIILNAVKNVVVAVVVYIHQLDEYGDKHRLMATRYGS